MRHELNRRSTTAIIALVAVVLLIAGSGCRTAARLERLEQGVQRYLERAYATGFDGRAAEPLSLERYHEPTPEQYPEQLNVDLKQSLALAARHNRDYQASKETLYLSALSLWTEAHNFEWNPAASLGALWSSDRQAGTRDADGDADFGLSRRFAGGARFSLSLALAALRSLAGDGDNSLSSALGMTLTQPLMAGRGRLVARESLTQAERNLLYAWRTYSRSRKSLLLNVATDYYQALSAYDSLEVARRNADNLRAARERSEDLALAGRLPSVQLDQARQDELRAQATLVSAQQRLDSQLDSLKTSLGLPLQVRLEADRRDFERLAAAGLPAPPLSFEQALQGALQTRLDFATDRDRLADADRAVRIAADDLRATLDLKIAANASSPGGPQLQLFRVGDGFYTASLAADLPLDKTFELAAFRRAEIARARQARQVAASRDAITARLRADWRDLNSGAENYRIQKLSVELARRRIESSEILLEAGRVNMRDLLEARDSLINAENSLTQALVNHRLTWLRLLFDMEALPVEPDSLWSPALELAEAGI